MKPNSIASFDEQNLDDISNEESIDMIDDYNNEDTDNIIDDDQDEDDGSNKSTNINNSIDSSLSKSSSGDNLKKASKEIQPKRFVSIGSSKLIRKRKSRTTFNKIQLNILENEFLKSNFVSNDKIDLLIEMTGLDSRIIKNWFKNKRSRVLSDTKPVPLTTAITATATLATTSNLDLLISQSKLVSNQISPILKSNESLKSSSHDYSNNLNVSINNEININNNSNSNKNNQDNESNSNLNGLLNIVKSINNPTKITINKLLNYQDSNLKNDFKKVNKNRLINSENAINHKISKYKIYHLDDSICLKCLNNSKILCACNISKTALNRLYKNYSGFINASSNLETSNFHSVNKKPTTNNYVISYERFELFEADQNIEKVFQVL